MVLWGVGGYEHAGYVPAMASRRRRTRRWHCHRTTRVEGAGELDVGTATALREWKARRANATRHRGGCVLGWVVLVELGCGALSLVPSLCGHAQFRFLGAKPEILSCLPSETSPRRGLLIVACGVALNLVRDTRSLPSRQRW